MDKITRILMLYSLLAEGGRVNKTAFCAETDSLPRSFDRDIEDIRLFLSESYSDRELLYDRRENVYYLSSEQRTRLESFEYAIVRRILLDSRSLRSDELRGLLEHLAANTEGVSVPKENASLVPDDYQEPDYPRALIKLHGDLDACIRNHSVIRLQYLLDNGMIEIDLLPCAIYQVGGIFVILGLPLSESEDFPFRYMIERVDSFAVLRRQSGAEEAKVNRCLENFKEGRYKYF